MHGTKRYAQKAAAAVATEVERGSHRQTTRHTVGELLDRWMDHIEAQGRPPSTMTRYRSAISADIKPRLGDLPLAKVGPAELDGLCSRLAWTGLSPLSIRKSHAILSAAFNQAVRWGWVDVNPRLTAVESRSGPPRREWSSS